MRCEFAVTLSSLSLPLTKIAHILAMEPDEDDDIAKAASARKGSPFLNTPQAAHYLCLSSRRLEEMREDGTGPIYRKHGASVRYHIKDLDTWSEACKRVYTRQQVPSEKPK